MRSARHPRSSCRRHRFRGQAAPSPRPPHRCAFHLSDTGADFLPDAGQPFPCGASQARNAALRSPIPCRTRCLLSPSCRPGAEGRQRCAPSVREDPTPRAARGSCRMVSRHGPGSGRTGSGRPGCGRAGDGAGWFGQRRKGRTGGGSGAARGVESRRGRACKLIGGVRTTALGPPRIGVRWRCGSRHPDERSPPDASPAGFVGPATFVRPLRAAAGGTQRPDLCSRPWLRTFVSRQILAPDTPPIGRDSPVSALSCRIRAGTRPIAEIHGDSHPASRAPQSNLAGCRPDARDGGRGGGARPRRGHAPGRKRGAAAATAAGADEPGAPLRAAPVDPCGIPSL